MDLMRGWDGIRLRQQHTHGESNPEHFFVTADSMKSSGPDRHARPDISKLPLKVPACPLSVQLNRKTDAKNPQVNR
jgi:hypothetical protein